MIPLLMTVCTPMVQRMAEIPPAFFSRLPVLETESLILRKPARSDAKDIYRYACDKEVARYVLWEPHRSIGETRAFVRDLRYRIRSGYPSSWAVVLRGTGTVIGTIGFMWYSSENRSAELGYSFSREYWNRGYATQALDAVVGAAFRSLPLNRLEAQHDVRNPASGRVMQKCGFLQEGILRSRMINKGEFVDVALYAILRSDWENRQLCFEVPESGNYHLGLESESPGVSAIRETQFSSPPSAFGYKDVIFDRGKIIYRYDDNLFKR